MAYYIPETMRKTLFILSCIGFAAAPELANAQHKASARRPAAVLVMLNSESNRIAKFNTGNRTKDLEAVKYDAAEVMRVTKNDFHDHFRKTPVYYFMDTNIEKVKSGNLAGIVMNEDGSQAAHAPTSDFIIAYYGYPEFHTDPDVLFKKGLVIADSKMKQLTNGSIMSQAYFSYRRNKKYSYESKRFDINYVPIAKKLSKDMYKYTAKIKD